MVMAGVLEAIVGGKYEAFTGTHLEAKVWGLIPQSFLSVAWVRFAERDGAALPEGSATK